MEYPLISEYIKAIEMAGDNLKTLNYLRPVLDENGKVVSRSDDYTVVFKMRDERDGKLCAIKCFLKDPACFAKVYYHDSKAKNGEYYGYEQYVSSLRRNGEYYEEELRVNASQTDQNSYSVVLLDWVEDDVVVNASEYVVVEKSDEECGDDNIFYDLMIKFKNGCPLYFEFGYNEGEVMVCAPRCDDLDSVKSPFGEIRIPSIINYQNREYQVVGIGDSAFAGCTSLQEIEIPNSVTEIRWSAFEGCTSLQEIEIPDSVMEIGERAFEGCRSLRLIKILNSVTEIGACAFVGCTSLKEIEIPNSVTEICACAFQDCTSLSSVEIPNSVETIGDGVFAGTSVRIINHSPNYIVEDGALYTIDKKELLYVPNNVVTFKIPNLVTEIGWFAFEGCTSLQEIEIPNSVTEIGRFAFKDCTSLKEIKIPNSVETIGDGVFAGTSVRIINHSPNYTFEDDALYTIDKKELLYVPNDIVTFEIPNSVTEIVWSAFAGCSSLTSVEVPNSVTEIRWRVFAGCSSLEEIVIPNSVTKIGACVFEGCASLQEIEIPNSVTEIRWSAFAGCTSLQEIEIPNSVWYIGDSAFVGCTSLREVILHRNTSYGYGAFPSHTKITYVDD